MEAKLKMTNGFKAYKNISSCEKKCNKCGFATFSLHVLYSHQHKCRGLDIMTCCYCKRKFTRLLLFRQHKKTCQKGIQKKKVLKKIFIKNKLKAFGVISKTKDKKTQSKKPSKLSTIACPKCMKLFSSKSEYNAHSRKDSCSETSARKSFSSSTPKQPVPKVSHKEPSASSSQAKKDGIEILDSGIGVSCKWCKNMYPNQKILAKHLERSSLCASALHKQIYKEKKPVEHTARKTMQKCARKSFKRVAPQVDTRSARKSLPGPSRNRYAVDPSPLKSLNQCPVCYQKIPDPYKFFQHQKKLNHWGRATKAMNNKCKCPFCGKQFYQVRLLHAHVRNHANKSKPEIEFFLKKTTCAICAQIFGSETAKYQHMRYFHSKSSVDGSPKVSDSSSYNSLPLAVKQKLRLHPNTCPICSKEFPATYFRNKHFQENHLDAELECKFCKEKFNTVESLDNHMHDAHYDDFQFECLFCKINLATASHVVLHCTKVHSNQDPNKIIRSREDKTLVRAPGFEYPVPVQVGEEGSNVFYCDICDIHFLKKAGLQSHRQSKQHKDTVVQNLEKMEKSYAELPSPKRASKVKKATPDILTCSECSQDFASVKDFVPHRLGHFGKGKYLKISDLNLYTCEICGEVSNSHSKVQMHLFWHLQVNSTTTEKTSGKGKTDPIVPDRLSGQLVAKKSFGKSESQQEIVIGGVKKSLFTCENCSISFTTKSHYSLHVRKLCKKKPSVDKTKTQNVANSASSSKKKVSSHPKPLSEEEDDSSSSEEFKSTILCTICNCLFLSSLVKENHENFCKNASYHDFDTESSKEILKPFPELRGVIAICIGCSVVFNDIRTLKKHVLEHKSNKDSKQKEDKTSVNGPNSIDDILLSEDELPATPLPLDSLEGTSALNQQSKIISHNEEVEDVSDDSFSVLRDNFSQLFRILINDAELMKSLGFGVLQIDDVLISVLQQMGQSTVEKEDEESEIECFRKNIRIFLDFCLKDQVMELIGSETASVDDIVVEALKTFTDEEVTAS